MNRILLDDSYRGTGITVLMDKGKLIACAKGNGIDFRAIYHRYGIDINGNAPQPIIDRINDTVGRMTHRMVQLPYQGGVAHVRDSIR